MARVADASSLSVTAYGPGNSELGTQAAVKNGGAWAIQVVPQAIRYEVAVSR